jgi:hypothetical protein
MKAFVDKIREELLEQLRDEINEVAIDKNWIGGLEMLAEQAKQINEAEYYSQLKELAIRELLWEEDEFRKWMLKKYKEFRSLKG